jgi:hypothetical protein
MLAVIAFLALIAKDAMAGSATWGLKPTSNDWNTAANWTPETVPDGPTDIATFDVSNVTDVTVSDYVLLDSMVFNSGASAYNITFQGALEGTGVINNSGVIQNIDSVLGSGIGFSANATAGNAITYTNNGETTVGFAIVFNNSSNAGSATFINKGDSPGVLRAVLLFRDNSSAAKSTIVNGRYRRCHHRLYRIGDCREQHDHHLFRG